MENLIPIGTITKIHGYKGFIKAIIKTQKKTISIGKALFIEINKKPVPFIVEDFANSDEEYLIKFDDIENTTQAEEIVGLNIFIESTNIENNSDNFLNIEGYKVIDNVLGFVGIVNSIIKKPGQDLIEVFNNEKSFFLPCVKQIILKINHKEKTIFTEIPEGIISLNE